MRARTWSAISLLLFAGAIFCWWKGNERQARESRAAAQRSAAIAQEPAPVPPSQRFPLLTAMTANLSRSGPPGDDLAKGANRAPERRKTPPGDNPLRLRNTELGIDELARSASALLLRNAFLDSASQSELPIPGHLRAQGDPGSYIVQARGGLSEGFRAQLRACGATIVSYIPNHAYLVRASAASAEQLAQGPLTRAVVPYQPYFKLDPALLPLAVRQQALPEEQWLNVVGFPGEDGSARATLGALGAKIRAEGPSPFGPLFVVEPTPASLVALAAAPAVQLLEPFADRVLLNDLTRTRLGIAVTTTNLTNYLKLDGSNIWVNLNDTGVDREHVDLRGLNDEYRVYPTNSTDLDGHGTHVAGVIASSGSHGPVVTNVSLGTNGPTITNIPGSVVGANFRGMAPLANLFSQKVASRVPRRDRTNALLADNALQEVAASTNYLTLGRTNAMISNNSWTHPNRTEYDTSAASYDAAVRDALPEVPGSQAMVYVFSAGNAGGGNQAGNGGEPGSITSPGTGKNVITVGAVENWRGITYEVTNSIRMTNIVNDQTNVVDITITNQAFVGETDTDDEVAAFSARGNVGLGVEGTRGRFKPDVVAPGTYVLSTRAKEWQFAQFPTNAEVNVYPNQQLAPHGMNTYLIRVPTNAVQLVIEVITNGHSPKPFPALDIYFDPPGGLPTNLWMGTNFAVAPTNNARAGATNVSLTNLNAGYWFYRISNAHNLTVDFDLRTTLASTNETKDWAILTNLYAHMQETNYYRFESGTSAAAGGVSGLLALVQQFCEQNSISHSPALLKALLISGARSLSPRYNYQVRNLINYQGWGMPNLVTVLPEAMTNLAQRDKWPIQWLDQSPTNALATGGSHGYQVELTGDPGESDLRVTLVWTDPPGNPAAAIKLVNDLDLVVSNRVTHQVYIGNDIRESSDYNYVNATNEVQSLDALPFDNINNVENVLIRGPVGTNYSVFVVGRRVNVNAVTFPTNSPIADYGQIHTSGEVQDYALVVSLAGTNALKLTPFTLGGTNAISFVTNRAIWVTNGIPLLEQRAGAQSPLFNDVRGDTNFWATNDHHGLSNQWRFYVFTNAPLTNVAGASPEELGLTNGPYVALLTFVPPNLSVPRNGEGDIDLYVTRDDPKLLTLDPDAIQTAHKSLKRGGTELVYFTNSYIGEVFYVGVKAEDQMAVEFGFVALSSDEPFDSDKFGNRVLRGIPWRVVIPDGSPVKPEGGYVFAIGTTPINISRARVAHSLTHQQMGDLLGNLSHNGTFAVLNNHRSPSTVYPSLTNFYSFSYDDSPTRAKNLTNMIRTDGPGSLRNFIGDEGSGVWILTMVDNAPTHTGTVQQLSIELQPNLNLLLGATVWLEPGEWRDAFVDVPADASLLRVIVSSLTGRLNLYLRRDVPPSTNVYDKFAALDPPGGELTVGPTDTPPLAPGRYFLGLYNPGTTTISFHIQVRIERSISVLTEGDFEVTNRVFLQDDVRNVDTISVTNAGKINDLRVGVRLDHPRVSDLDLHLVSPSGVRVLLNENRGGTNRAQLGYDHLETNFQHVALTYLTLSTNASRAALYLNGELLCTNYFTNFLGELQTTNELYLGFKAATNQPSQYYGGLDEVDLYGRALAASEILALYKFGGAAKPTNGLISRWQFDGNGDDWLTNNPAEVIGPAYDAGRFNQGLVFGRLRDRVRVSTTNGFGLNAATNEGFTIDAWINPLNLTNERPIAVWSDGTNAAGVEFFIRPGPDTNLPPGQLAARLVDVTGVTNEFYAPAQGQMATNSFLTNLVYVTFTDDTNFALMPIKFGDPPAEGNPSLTNRFLSGFENETANKTATFQAAHLSGRAQNDFFDLNLTGVPITPARLRTSAWEVLTNEVTVLQAVTPAHVSTNALAHTGTNVLILRQGKIGRVLPTLPGRVYRLQLVHRRQPAFPETVGWWPGDGNTRDAFGTNDATAMGLVTNRAAMVGRGFSFTTNSYLEVPARPEFNLTNELTMEMWLYPSNQLSFGGGLLAKRQDADPFLANYAASIGLGGVDLWYNDPNVMSPLTDDPGSPFEVARYFPPPTPGVFHHFAGSLAQLNPAQIELRLYLDGELKYSKVLPGDLANTVNNAPLLIGATLPGLDTFDGILDEVTLLNRALSAQQVADIYHMDRVGKLHPPFNTLTKLTVGTNRTATFFSDSLWLTNAVTFQATTNKTWVELEALFPGAMIDSVEFSEIADLYYLPEETLKPLIGEVAAGTWRLEVSDRFVGDGTGQTNAAPTNHVLISWYLDFTFSPPAYPVVTLTNSVPYTNSLPVGESRFFIVEVPRGVLRVTNTVVANVGMDLFFNQNGLPLTGAAGDRQLLTNATYGVSVISTNGTFQTDTNGAPITATNRVPVLQPGQRYYLALTNSTATTNYLIQVDFNLPFTIPLTNRQIIRTNIAVTNELHYYRYHVSTNATQMACELSSTNGNVDLFVRRAEPNPWLLPTPVDLSSVDYQSRNLDTNAESIVITPNSTPMPLAAGDWYLGVLNVDTNTVTYSLRVVESTNLPVEVIFLTNAVERVETVSPTNRLVKLFVFSVSNSPPAVQFDLYGLEAEADLLASQYVWPEPGSAYQDHGSPAAPARMVFRDLEFPDLNGDWYLVVTNVLADTTFTLMASLPTNQVIQTLTNTVAFTNTVPFGVTPDYYVFTVPTNALQADFELLPVNGDVDLYLKKDFPPPDFFTAEAFSANPGVTNELIHLDASDPLTPLTPGDYYLSVYNLQPQPQFSVTYSLRATWSAVQPTLWELTNGLAMTNLVLSGPTPQYYLYTVPSNSLATWFEVTPADGDVDVYARYGLPYPDFTSFDVASATVGPDPEVIRLRAGDRAALLRPGDWYLAVYGRTPANVVSYRIVATTPSVNGVDNGLWANLTTGDGAVPDFLIFTVPTNAVAAWFETSAADGDVDLYVRKGLPLPDVDAYDAASVQGGTTNEVIRLRVGDPLASLTAGDWFITVRRNSAGSAVRYRLRATAPAAWDLLTGVPATNTLSAGAAQQYYRFTVSTNAIAVWFDLYGGSHDLALYGKDGLPVPDLDQNLFNLPGAGLDQARIVLTNLVIPGDWYLTVANQEVGPVTYGLRAIELIPPSIDFNSIRVTADRVQFEWTASPGLDFQVEAATNIPPVWAVVTNGVSFLNGRYLFQEDETQTTGRLPFKMYRVRITP